MTNGEEPEGLNLQELLKEMMAQEHFFIEAHQRAFAFFATFNSAVLAAVVAGAMQANEKTDFIFLLFGSAVIFMISTLGKEGTFRYYQRILETVTVKAKIEAALGMMDTPAQGKLSRGLWPNEALIAPRNAESRYKYFSSSSFLDSHKYEGMQKTIRQTFLFFQVLAIVLAVLLACLGLDLKETNNLKETNKKSAFAKPMLFQRFVWINKI